jgi:adenosylmethionine-8-amino-7-oxononanoate aminotransferase
MIIAPPLILSRSEADELIEKAIRTLDMTHQHARNAGLLH